MGWITYHGWVQIVVSYTTNRRLVNGEGLMGKSCNVHFQMTLCLSYKETYVNIIHGHHSSAKLISIRIIWQSLSVLVIKCSCWKLQDTLARIWLIGVSEESTILGIGVQEFLCSRGIHKERGEGACGHTWSLSWLRSTGVSVHRRL